MTSAKLLAVSIVITRCFSSVPKLFLLSTRTKTVTKKTQDNQLVCSIHMRQICIQVSTILQMKLVGLKPKTALPKHHAQSVIVAPEAALEVANSSEAIVSVVNVIWSAGFVHERSTLCLQNSTIRRTADDKHRALVREILRDVDAKSIASSVVCADLPFDSSIAS